MKITRGEWEIKHSESKDAFNIVGTIPGGNYKIARCPYFVDERLPEYSARNRKEAEANAKLIADAGTTANKCGLLPSELLEQRDELLKEVESLIDALKMDLPVEQYNELHPYHTAKKLIQSIEQ